MVNYPTQSLQWPARARVAVSFVINVEEGTEMSVARGDRGMEPVDELGVFVKSPRRNHGNESNYLYGLKAGAPRVISLFDRYGVAATWAVAAQSLEAVPELGGAIADLNHEPCAHGNRWIHQFKMSIDEERAFIEAAGTLIAHHCGRRPVGWLSRYLHTDNTRALLAEAGYRYHMDDYSSDVPFFAVDHPGMVIVPYQLDTNDMKMWLNAAYTPDAWLKYLIDTFETLYEEGQSTPRMMSVGLHLRVVGRPGRIWALERFIQHVVAKEHVWIATREDIAEHFRSLAAP